MDYYFEATTAYTPEELRSLNRIHFSRIHKWPSLLVIVCAVLILAMGIFLMVLTRNFSDGIFPVCFGGALLWASWWLRSGRAAARRNASPLGVLTNRYRFYADRMEYANQQNQGFYYYNQLFHVYETWSHFYFYITKNQAFVLRKDGFTLGNADGLRQFLMPVLGPRFTPVDLQ